jgi:hypothetical protein
VEAVRLLLVLLPLVVQVLEEQEKTMLPVELQLLTLVLEEVVVATVEQEEQDQLESLL